MAHSEQVGGETVMVARAAGGDEEAFDILHRRHSEQAWRLAVAVTGDETDAAAVVPEAFGALFTGLRAGRISPEADLDTALLTAVRNAALDLRRSRRDQGDTGHDPSTHHQLLGRAYGQLPERWRSVLWLTAVEDVAPGSVAPIVDLSAHDTAQLAGRARRGLNEQFLRAHLEETGDRGCARAVARLGDHADGNLDDDDRAKLDRHLGLCEACRDRRDQLDDLPSRLVLLAPAAPAAVADDTRAAWTAATTPEKVRTATGLSPTAEKVLAGVSAVVAAAGVVGAALIGAGRGHADTAEAAPATPAATETDAPRPFRLDDTIDLSGAASTDPRADVPPRRHSTGGSVVPTADPGSDPAPADGLAPTAPLEPRATEPDAGGEAPADEPVVRAGTTVADQPIAVEVGADPGVTVGPVTLGSEPQPEPDEPVLELDGPLAPVGDAIGEVDDQLGLGLGG